MDSLGSQVLFVRTDVTSATEVAAAIAAGAKNFGGLQGVVNCAGILGASRVVGLERPHDLELFSRVIQINLIGTFNVLRLAAQTMSTLEPNEQGERGVIVNTASVSAFEGQLGQAAYAASKGGVASMTLPIARELAQFGIRVVSIAPGVFNTSMIALAPQSVQESLTAQTVFPARLGDPSEYAAFEQHRKPHVEWCRDPLGRCHAIAGQVAAGLPKLPRVATGTLANLRVAAGTSDSVV